MHGTVAYVLVRKPNPTPRKPLMVAIAVAVVLSLTGNQQADSRGDEGTIMPATTPLLSEPITASLVE